jgi:hypothetical protein
VYLVNPVNLAARVRTTGSLAVENKGLSLGDAVVLRIDGRGAGRPVLEVRLLLAVADGFGELGAAVFGGACCCSLNWIEAQGCWDLRHLPVILTYDLEHGGLSGESLVDDWSCPAGLECALPCLP